MSIYHYIIPRNEFSFETLNKKISQTENTVYEERGNKCYYYWIKNKSTRGVDVTIVENKIEIRNTVLSNSFDYELTNILIEKILEIADGTITNDEEETIKTFPIFNKNRITKIEINDCKIISLLSSTNKDIAIYGPIRKVHFGIATAKQLEQFKDIALRDKMFEIIKYVNYSIPNYEYGTIMEVGSEENKKIIKLLTNEVNCIIDKYDYILLQNDNPEVMPIFITNEILNSMLPSNWNLIDEFTIVAPIISYEEWQDLKLKAQLVDQFDKFSHER